MARAHITQQGQTWDEIAKKIYGSEKLMHVLIAANPRHRDALFLSGNIELVIPDIDVSELASALPPWERPDA